MDLKSGTPFPLIKNGLLFEYESLHEQAVADVIILGAGISGALSAYYLTQAGLDCLVVDGRYIGGGSTCSSTSMLQYEIDVPLHKLQEMIGNEHAGKAYNLCGSSINKLAEIASKIGFEEYTFCKSLYFADSKKDIPFLKKELQARQNQNFEVDFLHTADIEKLFGFNAPAAILSQTAARTDAYGFTHALHQYNISKGCRVRDRTTIKKIDHHKDYVTLKTSMGHTLKAKYLVYATGYEAVNFIKKKIVKLLSTYAIVSENVAPSLPQFPTDTLMWNTANPYLYMRDAGHGRVIVGGRDDAFYNPAKRDRLLKEKAKKLEQDFKKLFPHLFFKKEFEWAGTFGSTKDGLPYIGPYKPLPNSYFALGFGGNGITFSQIAGEINRDLIVGKKNNDALLFSFER